MIIKIDAVELLDALALGAFGCSCGHYPKRRPGVTARYRLYMSVGSTCMVRPKARFPENDGLSITAAEVRKTQLWLTIANANHHDSGLGRLIAGGALRCQRQDFCDDNFGKDNMCL